MAQRTSHPMAASEQTLKEDPAAPPLEPRGGAVVFVGPTLDVASARRILDATYLPPAACGDLFCAAGRRPWAIGLIDGYFQQTPSVWHKEILWAMQRGIHVFGSASMGALRGAELAPFGMVGIGPIFEAFRDGALENDDEVTVAHRLPDPDATSPNYEAVSEALVNMRYTLQAAEHQGVVCPAEAEGLIQLMQGCFYPDRSYAHLLRLADQRDDLKDAARRLAPWLEHGRIDQKRLDALAMLRAMASSKASEPGPKSVRFAFQRTTMWIRMCSRLERPADSLDQNSEGPSSETLLDELRLRGAPYLKARSRALHRIWALETAEARGITVTQDADTLEDRRRALTRRWNDGGSLEINLETWASAQGLDGAMLDRLLSDEALIQKMERMATWSLPMQLLDHLRLQGQYGAWSDYAQRKDQLLRSRGLDQPNLTHLDVNEDALWTWYFENQLQRPVPDDLDAYAANLDFRNLDAMRQAVAKEYCWQREAPDEASHLNAHLPSEKESP